MIIRALPFALLAAISSPWTARAQQASAPAPAPAAPVFAPPATPPPSAQQRAMADDLARLTALLGRPPSGTDLAEARGALSGGKAYVYNFLDMRKNVFSSRVLDELDRQFTAALAAKDVKSTLFHFADSPVGEMFADTSTSATIPVPQIIALNEQAEQSAGARFRMVVFPASVEMAGAWRFYQIRFWLIDTKTHARVWSYLYAGKHMVFWRESENAESRAKKITEAALADLARTGVIG